ncbi:unnamed protein product [Boreogadus saida]
MIVLHRVNSRELDGRNDIMLQSKFTGGSLVVSKEHLSLLIFFLLWFSFHVPQYAKKRTPLSKPCTPPHCSCTFLLALLKQRRTGGLHAGVRETKGFRVQSRANNSSV